MAATVLTAQEGVRYAPRPTVREALRNPRILSKEVLAGLVVGIALIPEAISFSIIAGLDPKVGLYSSFIMAMVVAITGGRPAMITAATGAVALVIAPLVRDYGYEYMLAAIMLAGVFQIVLAVLGVAKLMRFIPRSVMVGFVNALAIMIFSAQLGELFGVPFAVYPLVALGLAIMVGMPKLTEVVPAPLVAIVVVTALCMAFGIDVPRVGDRGELPDTLPELVIPHVPLTWETLQIIAPYALGVALVGLMESLMTAKLIDEITDTHSNKTREGFGQGTANIVSALFGGMGGCAMIGQSMINVKASGARTRLSTFFAGAFLLGLMLLLNDLVGQIPMAALVAVMVMVSVGTFDWHSVTPATLRKLPVSETVTMLITVAVVLVTSNLAIGVVVGVLVASVVFVRNVAHLVEVTREEIDGVAHYAVRGQLLFASSNDLTTLFMYSSDPEEVVVDLTEATLWDASTIAALDSIEQRYAQYDKRVRFVGMSEQASAFHGRLTGAVG
ncbi:MULTISPECIES: SulP family inorganic anion transporter [unclassified Corynebacterium]|uniref:SulP family inorganic anion transporter n=1 Tax=unclassified Corynebacterium TaxID=2624378 RepID=UPI0008A640DC|nr:MULTISPECIES: SulP family inorganic anion transporter [unclassified Corynebacterium]OFP36280.1 sodium-independent anion transporter [Corynebacterium sp. HMSC071B10]OHF37168.1 sodium-independent anion transporter [Corynebacterium sp. HMSC074A01]